MVDKGSEFKKEFIKLMNRHNIKIQLAKKKETMSIVEKFYKSGLFRFKML